MVPFCYALAYWVRHQSDLTPRRGLSLGLVILACYFTHVLSVLVLLVSLGLMLLLSVRERTARENVVHVFALLSVGLLLLVFIATNESESVGVVFPSIGSIADRLRFFVEQGFLHAYSTGEIMVASGLSFLVWVIAVAATLKIEGLERDPAGPRPRSVALDFESTRAAHLRAEALIGR